LSECGLIQIQERVFSLNIARKYKITREMSQSFRAKYGFLKFRKDGAVTLQKGLPEPITAAPLHQAKCCSFGLNCSHYQNCSAIQIL